MFQPGALGLVCLAKFRLRVRIQGQDLRFTCTSQHRETERFTLYTPRELQLWSTQQRSTILIIGCLLNVKPETLHPIYEVKTGERCGCPRRSSVVSGWHMAFGGVGFRPSGTRFRQFRLSVCKMYGVLSLSLVEGSLQTMLRTSVHGS